MVRRKKRPSKVASDEALKRDAMFGVLGKKHGRCLYPVEPECRGKARRAHSIQNSGKLDELCEDDHVYTLESDPQFGDPPEMPRFKRIGRNRATTFMGLCNAHDRSLFAPIERNPIDLDNSEHVFLLTYRAVLKTLHEEQALASKTAKAFGRMVGSGSVSDRSEVVRAIRDGIDTNVSLILEEKEEMDRLYLDGRYHEVEREKLVWLPTRDPALGACTYVSTGSIGGGRERFCAINVFPHEGRHVAVFSFRRGGRLMVKKRFVGDLRFFPERRREQVASRILLENCPDPVLRPGVYESFDAEQERTIRAYYWQTAMLEHVNARHDLPSVLRQAATAHILEVSGGVSADDPRLNLFEAVA